MISFFSKLFFPILLFLNTISYQTTSSDLYKLDLSHTNEGYFLVEATSKCPLTVTVDTENQRKTYKYKLDGYEQAKITFPIGDGNYTVGIWSYTREKTYYTEEITQNVVVSLQSPNEPFLTDNTHVKFAKSDLCVKTASILHHIYNKDRLFVESVFKFADRNIEYDTETQKKILSNPTNIHHIPDPETTFKSKKGICCDTSSMITAMLRSQNIPTKLVYGYLENGDYHAWNEVLVNGMWLELDVAYKITDFQHRFVTTPVFIY